MTVGIVYGRCMRATLGQRNGAGEQMLCTLRRQAEEQRTGRAGRWEESRLCRDRANYFAGSVTANDLIDETERESGRRRGAQALALLTRRHLALRSGAPAVMGTGILMEYL